MWIAGAALPLLPIGYGLHCLYTHQATLPGSRGAHLELHGSAAIGLAIAYLAIGGFAHFHWFWGLRPHLERFSEPGKILSTLVFLPSFGFALYKILGSFAQ